MRHSIEFDLFGNQYRNLEFAAVDGVDILCDDDDKKTHPLQMLKHCDVWNGEAWIPLNSRERINDLVTDAAKMSTPMQVLDALIVMVFKLNFDFLKTWKPVNIPKRLLSDVPDDLEASRIDPVISLIVMSDKATMRELEEYYSTVDAFKIYDMIAVENVNRALGTEAAIADAKAKSKKQR
jgi:hypothetical protein